MRSKALEPFTFGYEWETYITGEDMLPIPAEDVIALGDRVQSEVPESRTGMDHVRGLSTKLLEIRSGILTDFTELERRTRRLFETTRRLAEEKKYVLLPIGANPLFGTAVGFHLHLGSIFSFREARQFSYLYIPYLPAIAALMANSPFWGYLEKPGDFKSYRLKYFADWCSIAVTVFQEEFLQFMWGNDIQIKGYQKPTVEIRIMDSPTSPSLLVETVVLLVSFAQYLAENAKPCEVKKELYIEYLLNRWRAAKFGLQAVFDWKGSKKRPASDVIREILELSAPYYRNCGIERLPLIEKMADKNVTQADFLLSLYDGGDLHVYLRNLANILKRDPDPFPEFLDNAEPLPEIYSGSIEDVILEAIDVETPFRVLYEVFELPYTVLEDILLKLEREGKIEIIRSPEKGLLFTRKR